MVEKGEWGGRKSEKGRYGERKVSMNESESDTWREKENGVTYPSFPKRVIERVFLYGI